MYVWIFQPVLAYYQKVGETNIQLCNSTLNRTNRVKSHGGDKLIFMILNVVDKQPNSC